MLFSRTSSRFLAAAAAVALGFLAGCESGSRSSVHGAVTYDGQPVDTGGIAFIPTEDAGAKVTGPATGEIHNGHYDLDSRRGPHPGKYRVELFWRQKTGKKVRGEGATMVDEIVQALPDKYNKDSELIVVVKSGRNKFDFDLKK